jgi:hypothetical protein
LSKWNEVKNKDLLGSCNSSRSVKIEITFK